jgi:ribosomal protein L37E
VKRCPKCGAPNFNYKENCASCSSSLKDAIMITKFNKKSINKESNEEDFVWDGYVKDYPLAKILVIVGILGLLVSLSMETTIGDFYNIGLLNDKQNYIIISSFLILIGVILHIYNSNFKDKKLPNGDSSSTHNVSNPINEDTIFSDKEIESETKECPDCAEMVKLRAKKCRFCGHEFC